MLLLVEPVANEGFKHFGRELHNRPSLKMLMSRSLEEGRRRTMMMMTLIVLIRMMMMMMVMMMTMLSMKTKMMIIRGC